MSFLIPEIQKEINIQIKEGKPKQDIYDGLKGKSKDKKKLAQTIQSTVSREKKQEFRIHNFVILLGIVLSSFFEFYLRRFDSFVLFNIVLILVCITFYVRYYVWIAVKGGLNIILFSLVLFNLERINQSEIIFYLAILFTSIIAIVFSLILVKKLNPRLKYKKDDASGRTVYDFLE